MKETVKQLVVKVLTWQAKLTLLRHKPFIIAVTGNLGKTSTKDAIFTVLKDSYHVRRSEKSMNSEFGVPLTILGQKSGWNNPLSWIKIIYEGMFVPFAKTYPTHLVLEVGADRPGDIKSITSWIKPDITIVTQFGQVPVHIEFFENRDEVIKEKGYLVEALKSDGLFIYNADDADAQKLLEKTSARKLSVGIREASTVKADRVRMYGKPMAGTEAEVTVDKEKVHLVLPEVVGRSPVYAALPALLIAHEFGIPMLVAAQSLRDGDTPKGRMRLLKGIHNSVIIDDTYNASPKATEHGLKTLAEMESIHTEHGIGRKIAVHGDMLELGDHTKDEHYKIGKIAAKSCHKLFTVGIRSRVTAEGARDGGMDDLNVVQCDSSLEAGRLLLEMVGEGDIVYVKGSQGVRMERAVKMILHETHDPKATLVRQESAWESR